MKRISSNGTYIYHLNADLNLPEFLSSVEKRKHLSRNPSLRHTIQLIQDFEMPDVCTGVSMSPDGRYALAAGTYKPRIRCYELAETSMKYEQGMDYEVLRTCFLANDFSKLVFLLDDRRLEFHVNGLRHFRMRVPAVGTDMCYSSQHAELWIAAGRRIHRVSLENGQYMAPLEADDDETRRLCVSEEFDLLAVGTNSGRIQIWDPRLRKLANSCQVQSSRACSISSIAFDPETPYKLCVGTSRGSVQLYDLRSSQPYLVKDTGFEVLETSFIHQKMVACCDRRYIRVFNEDSAEQKVVIPCSRKINSMCFAQRGSGLIFVPTDSPKIHTYFVPELGPAPSWCSYLDTIVEELKESVVWNDAYDGYVFVSRSELEELQLGRFLATSFAHAYLNGFIVEKNVYDRAAIKAGRKVAEQEAEIVRQKEETSDVKVNSDLHQELKDRGQQKIFDDNRFHGLFEDDEFQVDPDEVSAHHYHRLMRKKSALEKTEYPKMEKIVPRNVQHDEPPIHSFHVVAENEAEEDYEKPFTERLGKLSVIEEKVEEGGSMAVTFEPETPTTKRSKHSESNRERKERKKMFRSAGPLLKPMKSGGKRN